jgi:flavorubredoxin
MITRLTEDVTWIHECHDTENNNHIHSSIYLIEANDHYLLVDTGDLHYQGGVIDQITQVTDGEGLDSVFVSKSHMPHSANVTALKEKWSDLQVIFPGGINNVHGFPPVVQWPSFGTQELYGRKFDTTKGPLLDIDHCVWLYEHETGVFFTIDGYCSYHEPGTCGLLSDELDEDTSSEHIERFYRDILLWLEYADPDRVMNGIRELVNEYDPEIIAPGHGNPITSGDIPEYVDRLERAVNDIANSFEYPDTAQRS